MSDVKEALLLRKMKKISKRARHIADNSFSPAAELPNMIADLADSIIDLLEGKKP